MDELLARMHEALGQELLDRIKSGEATASELSVARQFLNDNKFTGKPEADNPLGKLADTLPAFDTDFQSH